MKHLLKLMDWSEKEITEVLNLADQLKYEKKNGIKHHILKVNLHLISADSVATA